MTAKTGVVVGRDGRVIWYQHGAVDKVSVERWLIKDNIFTHVHYNGMCNLSDGDVISFIEDDGYEVRVVTPDRRFVSLRRGDGKKNTFLGNDMKKVCRGRRFLDEVNKKTIEKYGGLKRHLQNNVLENMMNEWLSSRAAAYGYIFTQGRHEP